MIHEVAFLPPAPAIPAIPGGAYARWAWDLPEIAALDPARTVRFGPGLNVLFGRNGSGKTTILRTLALTLAATGTGRSVAGQEWLREAVDPRITQGDGPLPNVAARVVHDGKPVLYAAAGVTPGVSAHGISEEFFAQGVASSVSSRNSSAGERTFRSCAHVLDVLHGRAPFPEAIQRPLAARRPGLNSLWRDMIDCSEAEFLAARGPEGQPTILLDEPDAHWGFVAQANLWATLGRQALAKRYQIIVASHSPFALAVPHARVIGLPDEAVADTRLAIADLAARVAPGRTGRPRAGAAAKPAAKPATKPPAEPAAKPARKRSGAGPGVPAAE